jgi:DNA repair protein RecO (recombination protein O)
MSEIIKTDAIVLRKINFGDTSRIAHFYTHDFGKISAIIKGARTPKSKIGMAIDTINLVQLILYKKETREIQLVKDADLIMHFPHIKDDFEKMKYATAIIELLANLTLENEHNKRLFDGTVRILDLLDTSKNEALFLFAKYFFFFLKEIGYEFPIKNCSICGRELEKSDSACYNYEAGVMCKECSKDRLANFNFSEELFNTILCLNSKENNYVYKIEDLNFIIRMLEKYLMYNVHEFKGLKSLRID